MKKIAIGFCIIVQLGINAQSNNLPTITVEGKSTLSVDPDEISATFTINSESEISSGVKLSLNKIEEQIRSQFTKSNIPQAKLINVSDPKYCSPDTRNFSFDKLTLAEYNSLMPFLKKNLFISDFKQNNKLSNPETIKKYSEQLLKEAFLNSRKKAEVISTRMKETIKNIQSISNPIFLEDYSALQLVIDYVSLIKQFGEKGPNTSDFEINKLEFYSMIIVEYGLQLTTKQYPRFVHIDAIGKKSIPYQNVKYTFNMKIENYEEGEPTLIYNKMKADLISKLAKFGVISSDIQIKDNEDFEAEVAFKLKGEENIRTLYKTLKEDKNIANLNVINNNDNLGESIESDLLIKTMDNAEFKIKTIEKITGLKIGKCISFALQGETTYPKNLVLMMQKELSKSVYGKLGNFMGENSSESLEEELLRIGYIKYEILE